MGLRDKFKKKKTEFKEKPDTEIIGGLLADNPPPMTDLIDEPYPDLPGPGEAKPFAHGFPESAEGEEAEDQKNNDLMSSLDIFTQETAAEDEGFNLAARLSDIDIGQLLADCKDVAAQLKERKQTQSGR